MTTEGHIILDIEEKAEEIKVYHRKLKPGFENGIFTKISNSGAIPTVITYQRRGEYSLKEYQEPWMDRIIQIH